MHLGSTAILKIIIPAGSKSMGCTGTKTEVYLRILEIDGVIA